MSKKGLRWALLVVALGFFAWQRFAPHDKASGKVANRSSDAAVVAKRMLGTIAFTPCTLSPQLGAASVEAQCGSLVVPENAAAPDGRQITLNIAWLPSDEDGERAPDPVFMLAGGPGQSATETYPQVAAAFREVLKHRSVVLVDQRGTGKSKPLTCKSSDDDAALGDDDAAAVAALRAATERCRDALSKTADLRFYTTTDAVRDLDAVRAAIGAPQVNLIGVSYGTRVAQQYARTFASHTRTIVLDSVAPNAIYLGNDFARNLESALDLQFGRCAETPDCAKALGKPRERLDALMTRLKADPPLVTYRDSGTGETRQETLRPGHVAALARMYSYAPAAASILPLQLNEGAQGRFEGLMALSTMLIGNLEDQMAMGMQLSVICSEDADGLKDDPSMATSLLGNALVSGLRAQCEVWPKGTRPADFHAPLATRVPALLLSGELDPVTPPAYAEQVAKSLPNARALTLRGQGHNVIGAGCMPKLFAQFLDTANAKTLDAKCLDTLTGTPPFTGFNGWGP